MILSRYDFCLTTQAAPKPEDKRQPVSTRVRLKIFPYFLRSREAADHFPASIQVGDKDDWEREGEMERVKGHQA